MNSWWRLPVAASAAWFVQACVHHSYERPPTWSDWTRFSSAAGIFSVELPGTPQPAQTEQQSTEGEVRRVAVSAVHGPSNMRFAALCLHTDLPRLLDDDRAAEPKGFRLRREAELTAAGYPATQRELTGHGMLIVLRDIEVAKNAFCRQSVTLELLHEDESRAALDRFFGSFRIAPPDQWVPPLEG